MLIAATVWWSIELIVAAARSDPRRIAQGLNVVKVSVADVRVKHGQARRNREGFY